MTILTLGALTFPRDMPVRADGTQPFAQASFDTLYNQTVNPTRGGQPQVAQLGSDLWQMSFKSPVLEYVVAQELMSWCKSLRGGLRLFKAWHPLKRFLFNYPQGYGALTRAGGGAFDGTATLTVIGAQRDTVTITTLPANLVFKVGDMVSIDIGGTSRYLGEIMAETTANVSGIAVLTVEPVVPAAVVTSVGCTFLQPWCLAKIDSNSIRGPIAAGQNATVEFSAVQTY